MKQYRATFLMLGVLVLLGAFVFFTESANQDGSAQGQQEELRVFNYDEDEIVRLTVRDGERTVEVVRGEDGGSWRLTQPEADEADEWKVSSVLWRIAKLDADRRLMDEVDEPAAYGLDAPQTEVTLGLKDGSQAELRFGAENSRQTGYYAVKETGGPLYLINASLVHDLRKLTAEPPKKPTPTPPAPSPTVTPEATPTP